MRFTTALLLAAMVLSLASTVAAGTPRDYEIDLAVRRGDSPESVRGPVTLKLKNLNKVRYQVTIGQKVTLTDGPDLSPAKLIPAISSSVAMAGTPPKQMNGAATPASAALGFVPTPPAPAPCPPTSGTLEERFTALHVCLTLTANEVKTELSNAQRASTALNVQTREVEQLVAGSDQQLLGTSGATNLASEVGTVLKGISSTLSRTSWPADTDLSELRRYLKDLQDALTNLPFEAATGDDWKTWSSNNRNRYQQLGKDISRVGEALARIEQGSEARKAFDEALADLRTWQRLLTGLDDDRAYTAELVVRCGYPFFKNKTVDYTLTLVDRTIADKTKNKTVERIVSVVCPSNVTVTGGIGASGVDERDFGFVPSLPDPPDPDAPMDDMSSGDEAPALVTRIGLDNKSREQVNPTVLISTRLLTFDRKGAYAWHLTAGSVFDFDNPDSNVAIGYVLGTSFSFKDSVFLTLGAQASRVSELAGGFELDDLQPMGLDEVPVTKEWDYDWFLSVTYRLGGGN